MSAKYWIKLYHEILDDPKMGRLPDRLWRRTIEMFLLAGEMDQEDGRLPAPSDMSWRLRVSDDELEADLAELERIGLLTRLSDGAWTVTNFANRQAARTSTERTQEFRKRMRTATETPSERARDDGETFRPTDIESDSETESEKESPPPDDDSARAAPLNGQASHQQPDFPGLSTKLSTALKTADVNRKIWKDLVSSGRSEAELLALLAWSADSGSPKPGGVFVSRFRNGDIPPEKYFDPPHECCGHRGEHAKHCPQRLVSGSLSEFIEH